MAFPGSGAENQNFQGVGEEIKGEHELQHVEDPCGVMQTESKLAASVLVDSSQGQSHKLDDVPEDALGRCRLECSPRAVDFDPGKAPELNESVESLAGNPRSSHGLEMQDEGSKKLELDKTLPPIRTRREGDPREHSPSDLTPPSPKRLRQGSKESQEKWNGLWNTEGKP
ncbi:hypothetical protein GOP47_0011297 [Adiantum capillus-veneris]|uniref:Uncharacterized protein n=1 Tax=Adiantum capillus-veneris TaxID=13818 RepID=A0A9D4ZF97_ADICA|nr:hypothetical protein GOP47_0011297 [Adiantum capillus-veneris]